MTTSSIALERVQALLQVDVDSTPYDQLLSAARAAAGSKASEVVAKLEALGRLSKQAGYRGAPAPDQELRIVADAAAEERRQRWCEEVPRLLRAPSDPASAPKVLAAVRDFMEDAAMLEWAGVGFGKQESLHIAMSLRKLAAETPTMVNLRLWGKVLGSRGDYYVAEGQLEAAPAPAPAAPNAPPPPPLVPGTPDYDLEPRGQGANTYTYWASAGGAAPWVRLPAARASHVAAARSIRRVLTGDLSSPVHALNCYFPMDERYLLRAQIARISATCTLAVRGWFEPDDDPEAPGKHRIKEVEGAAEAFPSQEELTKQGGWVHAAPCLLSTGRTTWPETDALEGLLSEEALKELQQQIEDEPEKGILEPIETDLEEFKPEDAEGSPAWCVRAYGTEGLASVSSERTCRAVAVHSLLWPGAVTVAAGTRFANLYIGYAQKCSTLLPPPKEGGQPLRGASPFTGLVPGDIMEEPKDLPEQEEPNPQTEEAESDKGDIDDE